MKRTIWILIMASAVIVFLLSGALVQCGQVRSSEPDPVSGDMMKELRDEQENLRMLSMRYPDPPVTFAQAVLKDLTASHPTILLDVAIDVMDLIASRYPMLPYDLVTWRAASHSKEKALKRIQSSYPGFDSDFLAVLESNSYPEKFYSLRSDIGNMLAGKYPTLGPASRLHSEKMINDKYPGLRLQIMEIQENQNLNPHFEVLKVLCTRYPSFYADLLREMRQSNGVEIHQALIDTLGILESRYSGVFSGLKNDMMTMTESKYPGMMREMAEIEVQSADQTAGEIEQKYPGFYEDLARLLQKKYPALRSEIADSMKAHFPEVKADIENIVPAPAAQDLLQRRKWMVKLLLFWSEAERTRRIL